MALEPGGYAGKMGPRYEQLWGVKQLLRLIQEQIRSVTFEPVGDDEVGVDLWIESQRGVREAYQCKAENGTKDSWSMADLIREGVIAKAIYQLRRLPDCRFHFVSAVPATQLLDLARSAKDSNGDPKDYYEHQVCLNKTKKDAFHRLCEAAGLDLNQSSSITVAMDLLSRIDVDLFANDESTRDDLNSLAQVLVQGDSENTISALMEYAAVNLRRTIIPADVSGYLTDRGLPMRTLVADPRVDLRVNEQVQQFQGSLRPTLATGHLIPRDESQKLLSQIRDENSPAIIVLESIRKLVLT